MDFLLTGSRAPEETGEIFRKPFIRHDGRLFLFPPLRDDILCQTSFRWESAEGEP